MDVKRLFDILDIYVDREDAVVGKLNGEWVKYSTTEYKNNANYFSYGLLDYGIKKGDKVATVMNNRPEWNFIDMGITQVGGVHVPVYPTISDEEFEHIFTHSDAKFLIVSDKLLYDRLSKIADKIPKLEKIISVDKIDGAENWKDILDGGKNNEAKYKEELIKVKNSIIETDLVSIIYTSGTTGVSKGVMLSHKNFLENAKAVLHLVPLNSDDKVLSFLPLCHVLERVVNYIYQYIGIGIYYAENFGTIANDLKQFNVNGFVTVPRVLEMVYDKIISKGKDLTGIKKKLFFWAVDLGTVYSLEKDKGLYGLKLKIARKLIFSKWNEALGGNVRMIVTGGAALQPRLARIFSAAGMIVQEGYGLTETSPIISFNGFSAHNNMAGTVGPIIDGGELQLAKDGEILFRGPNVMMGYYKNEELTKEVIDEEGWFKTGDIGILVDNKFLKITDRKKEIFKNSAGKYIAPQSIENKLKESLFIDQLMVVGEDEKFTSALISPNFDHLHFWASKHNIHYRDNIELVKNTEVIKKYQQEVTGFNKSLGQVEQIKRFRLVCELWTSASGELSPTLKLRRFKIYEKYDRILREIYQYREDEVNRSAKGE